MKQTVHYILFVWTVKQTKTLQKKNRQNIIDKRKSDHYNEVLEGWQKKKTAGRSIKRMLQRFHLRIP